MTDKTNTRRRFLRNSSLAALSAALVPLSSKASTPREANAEALGDCMPTTLDYYGQGPFYTPNAPTIADNQLAPAGEPGTPLTITGRVLDLTCDAFIPGTLIDIWHADDAGSYDNNGYHLRGQTVSNAQGFFVFETILPGKYLNGQQFRPAHIHFKITSPNHPELTTQLYFEGDPEIPADAAASITSGTYDASHRIIALSENTDGSLEGVWDIVVDGDGTTGINDLHREKGMIYSAAPSPFTETLTIKYGIFAAAKIALEIFDMDGRSVATLEEASLSPGKYEAVWQPSSYMGSGTYFVALKVNDLQVHYLKVVKA
jgi:protocatechuate 3,4-dioxygenase beta subunit